MKNLVSLPFILLLSYELAQAQIIPGGVPFVNDTPTRFTASFDHNGDGRTDVVDLNKAQGTFSLGTRQADGSFVWSPPRAIGYSDVSAMAVGRFINPTQYALSTCSPDFNNVQLVPLDGSDLPAPLSGFNPPEPQALATVPPSGFGVDGSAVGYAYPANSNGQPSPLKLLRQNSFFGWSNYSLGKNPRYGSALHTRNAVPSTLACLTDSPTGGTARLQFFFGDENSSYVVTEWPSLPVTSRYVQGFFTADSTSHGLGHRSTTLVSWQPGQSSLRIARLTDYDQPNDLLLGNLEVPASSYRTYSMQRPIRTVYVLLKAGSSHRLLITWADAAGGASVHSFDGETVPDLIEGVALNGLTPDAIAPLAGGDFVTLGTRNGLPTHEVFSETTPGHYSPIHTGIFPTVPDKSLYSNVVAFQGEPMVNPEASALKRTRVADWSTAGTPPATFPPSASITALTDTTPTLGLSNPASSNVTVSGSTTHFLLNQLGPNASVAFVSAKTVQQSILPKIIFQPVGGFYPTLAPGAVFEVYLSDTAGGFDGSISYSLNGGPWQYASRTDPIVITGNATLRAYSFSYARGTGPIHTASYSFGSVPPVAVQPQVDADMNGLADTWESLTGINNPAGDNDNDGFLNLAEYNAGFDPNDPLSKPVALAIAPQLSVTNTSGPNLRWDATDTAILLETSADLQTWTLVTHGTRTVGNQRIFDLPTQSFPYRFYRLRR